MSILDRLYFRASGIAPLFTGTDGLTAAQYSRLTELVNRHSDYLTEQDPKLRAKYKLTDKMTEELEELLKKKEDFDNGIVEPPKGAKSYIESQVDQIVYGYRPSFSDWKTEKGNRMEGEAIELANTYFMTDYKKSDSELRFGNVVGHPDIEDKREKLIADIKCPYTKDTHPKLARHIDSSTYEWQLKTYLWLKSKITKKHWRKARLIYTLMSTPEDLVPERDGDDLHYVDDLDIGLRVTYIDFELTDADIAHMERRLSAALKYAEEYYNELTSKCLN